MISRAYAISLAAGPLLLLASTIVFLANGEGVNHGVIGGTISTWAAFCLIIGFIGLSRAFEVAAPKSAAALAVLSVLGFVTGYGYGIEAIHREHLGADVWSRPFDNPLGYLAFDPWGLGLPLALALASLLVWRTGEFPRWPAIPLLIAALTFIPSREGVDALAAPTDVLLCVALLPLAAAMLRRGRQQAPD